MLGPFWRCFLVISPQYVVQFWSTFDPHVTPLNIEEIEEKKIPVLNKTNYRAIQLYQNQVLSPFSGKIRLFFAFEHHR